MPYDKTKLFTHQFPQTLLSLPLSLAPNPLFALCGEQNSHPFSASKRASGKTASFECARREILSHPPLLFPTRGSPNSARRLLDDGGAVESLPKGLKFVFGLFFLASSLSHFLLRVERRGVLRGRKVERVLGFASFNNKDTHREMGTQEGNRWVTRLKGLEGDRTGRNRVFCTTTSANSMMKL